MRSRSVRGSRRNCRGGSRRKGFRGGTSHDICTGDDCNWTGYASHDICTGGDCNWTGLPQVNQM